LQDGRPVRRGGRGDGRSNPAPRALRIGLTIHLICGQKVMLDSDLASLYGIAPRRLNEQVRRNIERLPSDFMFELNPAEAELLRSQFATLEPGRGKRRKYLPHAFTEHGAD